MGGFSGKVGTVVGFFWKGKAIMRGLAGKVANPRTNPQLAVRDAFTKLIVVGSAVNEFIKVTFAGIAAQKKVTAGNAFTATNFDGGAIILNKENGNATLDVSKLILAPQRGGGVNVQSPSAQVTAQGVAVAWSDNSGIAPNVLSGDKVLVALYCPEHNGAVVSMGEATRGDEGVQLSYPLMWAGSMAYLFIATHVRDLSVDEQSSSMLVTSLSLT